MWRTVIFVVAALAVLSVYANDCVRRKSVGSGDDDGHYCVCNATYCDSTPSLRKPLDPSKFNIVSSSKSGLRFQLSQGQFEKNVASDCPRKIVVDPSDRYQSIIGFGGAVTDSVGYNIKSLSSKAMKMLMRNYFGPEGLEYNIIRVPMAATDFSFRNYSYDDVSNDKSLSHFRLRAEDTKLKIPILRIAKYLSEKEIRLIATPWSASKWMKTSNSWPNEGSLLPEYSQTWADYFVRFFQSYQNQDLDFWGLTPQNEPDIGIYAGKIPTGMLMSTDQQRDLIVNYLWPAMQEAGFKDIKILIGDLASRSGLLDWAKQVMGDEKARKVVAGSAVHWYYDNITSPDVLTETKEMFPEKIILYTEACSGVVTDPRVLLGSWQRGENYAKNIIEVLSHWVSGWVDWNIALNLEGGPSVNHVDSPIIVNATADEFYKQPMFYAMGHFSKYIPPDSVRIGTKSAGMEGVKHVAFSKPDNDTVLVMLNTDESEAEIMVEDRLKGVAKLILPPKSINTLTYGYLSNTKN
ncbi:hypothetical protein KM043_015822 [Ampulex compressa]|nr:hypothetical protein KM043_015822 [Ampulex compressa]